MGSCFVIQPFDKGAYDKRYDDVFEPAIRAAGLEPYRVDRDPSSAIPIESIEAGIQAADICFAEITTDNANVWYELGFAVASGKPVVLASAEGRDRFPFDIQHRNVVTYKTESTSDFADATKRITARLEGTLRTRVTTAEVASSAVVASQAGLTPEQLSALVVVAQRTGMTGDAVSVYELGHEMSNVGFTAIATTLGVRGLVRMGLCEAFDEMDRDENQYTALRATEQGLDWLETNKDRLVLRRASVAATPQPTDDTDIDDLPF